MDLELPMLFHHRDDARFSASQKVVLLVLYCYSFVTELVKDQNRCLHDLELVQARRKDLGQDSIQVPGKAKRAFP